MSPIYQYMCESCETISDEMFSISERPDEIRCKICSGIAKREVTATNFKVKGANAANNYSGADNFRWIKPKV